MLPVPMKETEPARFNKVIVVRDVYTPLVLLKPSLLVLCAAHADETLPRQSR